jgi:hypothetical protein
MEKASQDGPITVEETKTIETSLEAVKREAFAAIFHQ